MSFYENNRFTMFPKLQVQNASYSLVISIRNKRNSILEANTTLTEASSKLNKIIDFP